MAITRIKNNQITDLTVNAAAKLQDFSITSGKIANDLTYGSNFTVQGNLTVQGSTTTIDTVNLVVEDPLILLAKEQTGSPALDIGFIGKRGTEDNIAFVWDESADEFATIFTTDENTNTVVSINAYASLRTLDLSVTGNLVVSGTTEFAGNIANIVVTGNVTGGNFLTPGLIEAAGNIDGANVNTGNLSLTGNVLTDLNVDGNITGANIQTVGLISASGNIDGANLNTTGEVVATGNVSGGNITTAGEVVATGNVSGGNITTAGEVVATGNVSGGNANFTGDMASDTIHTTGNALIGGNLIVQGNLTYTNVEDLRIVDPVIIMGTGANGTPPSVDDGEDRGIFMEYYTTSWGNAFVGWDRSLNDIIVATSVDFSANNVVNVLEYGTFTAGNANLQSAVATGNIEGGNLVTGGVLDVTGNINGANVNTGNLSLTGNVLTNLNVTGNVDGGNLLTSGLILATGNIDGGNLNTAGEVVATGNVTGGNINTAGEVVATGTITGGNLVTAGNGNIGNIRIAGNDITGTDGIVTFNAAGSDVDFAFSTDNVPNAFFIDGGTGTAAFGNAGAIDNAIVSFNGTSSIRMPVGNITQRPDPASIGMVRFSTSSDALEVYTSGGWENVGVPEFTVVVADDFTGDGSTVAFTLTEESTTAATIVSINGVVQEPTVAYSVTGNVLTFTEAPLSTDVIDARLITTTTTIVGISNTPGNAAISVADDSNVVTVTGDLSVSGTIIGLSADAISNGTSNVKVLSSNGNIAVTVGGSGIVTFASSGIINDMGNGVGNIGNATGYFNTIFAQATSAQYADLAEMYEADQIIEPGTVVCFGGAKEVTVCDTEASARVAGVISTNPSYIMNAGLAGDHVVAVALTGRVPTRVTGSVRKGDMMVSAGDGRARSEANPRIGTVIGKALADFDGTDGVIEVVIGRL